MYNLFLKTTRTFKPPGKILRSFIETGILGRKLDWPIVYVEFWNSQLNRNIVMLIEEFYMSVTTVYYSVEKLPPVSIKANMK